MHAIGPSSTCRIALELLSDPSNSIGSGNFIRCWDVFIQKLMPEKCTARNREPAFFERP